MELSPTITKLCQSVTYRVVWYVAGAGLLALVGLLLFAVSSQVRHEEERLSGLAPLVARSISGEIFVDDGRSMRAILPEVARKFSLQKVDVSRGESDLSCETSRVRSFLHNEVCQSTKINVAGRPVSITLWSEITFQFSKGIALFSLVFLFSIVGLGAALGIQTRRQLAHSLKPLEEQELRAKRVSHDIRSPLFALKVLSEDMTSAPEPQRRLLQTAVERINNIANDLVTTPSSPGRKTAHAWGIVEEIISEKYLQYQHRNNLRFEISCDPKAKNSHIATDPTEIKRALSNLMNNSAEAIESEGRVFVRQSILDGMLLWEIADSGKGIPEERIAEVLSGKSYGKKNGQGLGLSGAKRLVEAEKGSLELTSRPGQGTTVRIFLPTV